MKTGPGRQTGILACAAFLLAEAVLFGWILRTTFGEGNGDAARYASIVLCAVFALARLAAAAKCGKRSRIAEAAFLFAAFVFSAAADWFLVFDPVRALPAVCLFGIAQIFHALRVMNAAGGLSKRWLAVRLLLLAAGAAVLAVSRIRDPLIYAGTFYILNLTVSFARSFGPAVRTRAYRILPAGLFLFILCDVTVGLRGMGASWGLPGQLLRTAADLTYIFYVPSQVLIALAGIEFRRRDASWKTS